MQLEVYFLASFKYTPMTINLIVPVSNYLHILKILSPSVATSIFESVFLNYTNAGLAGIKELSNDSGN